MPPAAYSQAQEVLAPTFNQIAQALPGGAAVTSSAQRSGP